MKKKKYDELAGQILEKIGGRDNIAFCTHCITRLRFNLKDESLAVSPEEMGKTAGVMGCKIQAGQYQVIIGQHVGDVYDNLCEIGKIERQSVINENVDGPVAKKGLLNRFFDTLSGIFVQFIPLLIAAGLISAVLSILTTFGFVSTESPTYIVLNAVQSAVFFFLPMFVGYAAGAKLGCNPFLGMGLGAVLCSSAINGVEGLSIAGLPIAAVTYSTTVFPVLLGVLLMRYVERGLKKIVPNLLRSVLVPMLTLLVGVVATLLVLGPIGSWIGMGLYHIIDFISLHAGWLAPALIALIYPVMVFTGAHYSMITITVIALATYGFDPILMVADFVGNIAEGGAGIATALLTKNAEKKSNAISAGISALCGVTEPMLFGYTMSNKMTLLAVCLGGFAGSLFAGITGCHAYNFVGGLPSLPLFMNPSGNMANLIFAVISILIGFAVTFVLTLALNRKGRKAE